MSDVGPTRGRRATRVLAGTVLLAGLLVGCGQSPPLAVSAAAPPVPVPASLEPTTSFQGAVAAIDAHAGTMTVAVQIVWTPVLQAGAHERRVLVDAGTRWDPAPAGLTSLLVGEEVQVEALDAVEGVWPALKIQLLDID